MSRDRRPRRVLIVIENLPLQRDSRVRRECRSLLDAGYEVTVVCPASSTMLDPSLGAVSLLTYPRRRDAARPLGYVAEYLYSLIASAALVGWAVVRGRVDVIQVCTPPDLLALAVAPYRLFGVPFVFDHHDLSPELYQARFRRGGLVLRLLLWAERAAVRVADRVVCANETILGIVVARTGVAARKCTVVRNGPSLHAVAAIPPGDPALRRGRDRLCCWHGMMGVEDGVDLAVRAAAELVHGIGRHDCHFAFVGDGEVRPQMEQLADDLGIGPWVSFPGWLERDRVYEYLATADVGLSPDPSGNHLDWSTPIKAVEYMGFGVPVVGFENEELIETAGEAAVVVGGNAPELMAKAIDALLADESQRRERGAAGRARVLSHLAWDHQADAYLEVYRTLMGPQADTPRSNRQAGWRLTAKRVIDVVVAAVALAVTAPLQAACAIAILVETGRPVLYRSTRVGKDHRTFEMLKLRSMVADADDARHREFITRALGSGESDGDSPPTEAKLQDDPRITRVGRVMRRTSLDELPQLLNVLRGEMSLVGPRPDVPYSVELYEPRHHRRFDVLPGMTGLWQVKGRSTVDALQMLELDLEYVERWSIGLDLQILGRTVPCLLTKRGAGA